MGLYKNNSLVKSIVISHDLKPLIRGSIIVLLFFF